MCSRQLPLRAREEDEAGDRHSGRGGGRWAPLARKMVVLPQKCTETLEGSKPGCVGRRDLGPGAPSFPEDPFKESQICSLSPGGDLTLCQSPASPAQKDGGEGWMAGPALVLALHGPSGDAKPSSPSLPCNSHLPATSEPPLIAPHPEPPPGSAGLKGRRGGSCKRSETVFRNEEFTKGRAMAK